MRRPLALLTLAALPLASLVACGDDDEGGGEAAASGPERYCELSADLEAAPDPTADLPEDADEQDAEEAVRESFRESEDTIDALEEAAPDEIVDDVRTLVETVREFIDGGSLEDAGTNEEVTEATGRIEAWEEENCPDDPATAGDSEEQTEG